MSPKQWTVFETALGYCGLLWGPRGLAGVMLAQPNRARLVQQLVADHGADAERSVPRELRSVVTRLRGHLAGKPQRFDDVPIDLERATPFQRRIYQTLRRVGVGQVITYGELARRVGREQAARAVGGAVARNPVPIVVPCHRVIAAGGKAGGFTAPGGVTTKMRLLGLEGVELGTG